MPEALSVFLDFNLPKATTWFYFSLLLAVALFFKFGRLLSIRNWDVVLLFALVPGLLLVNAARPSGTPAAELVAIGSAGDSPLGLAAHAAALGQHPAAFEAGRWLWFGYLWLMIGSTYFFCRCVFDLTLVQRPALAPNLSFGGLAWLAGALLICLVAVAFRQPDRAAEATPLLFLRHFADPPAWACRLLAVLGHVAVVTGLVVVGWRHFGDAASGMAAATFYLMLPYTGLYVGLLHHVWPAAVLVWALAGYRYPTFAGVLLGLAAGTTFFPVVLLPIWLSFYWRRGLGRFLAAFALAAALCVFNLGVAASADDAVAALLSELLTGWLPWRVPAGEGFWTGVHAAYRLPVLLVYAVFLLATAVWPMPKSLAHLIALSSAALAGLQLWYADQGGIYVLWYLPLLLLLVFRPNLHEHRPPPIHPDTDWLARARKLVVRLFRWMARMPEPAQARAV